MERYDRFVVVWGEGREKFQSWAQSLHLRHDFGVGQIQLLLVQFVPVFVEFHFVEGRATTEGDPVAQNHRFKTGFDRRVNAVCVEEVCRAGELAECPLYGQ